MTPTTLTVPSRTPQIMRRIGPPSTCYVCFHPWCEEKRRHTRLACHRCGHPVAAGDAYYVTAKLPSGEVTEHEHLTCAESPR